MMMNVKTWLIAVMLVGFGPSGGCSGNSDESVDASIDEDPDRDAGFDADAGHEGDTGLDGDVDTDGGTDSGDDADTGGDDIPPPVGVLAVMVVDFLDSIGACTHIAQGEDDHTRVGDCLEYTGIRNIRDDFSGNESTVQGWINIHNQTGARLSLLTSNGNVENTVATAEQLASAGALLAVEGPNEPNNWPVTYEGETSDYDTTFLPVAHFQRDVYAAVKDSSILHDIPVFHSSEAGGAEPDNVGLQFLTIPGGAGTLMPDGTEYADYANCHNYVSRRDDITADNICWDNFDSTLDAGYVDGLYAEYGHTWHGGFQGYSSEDLETLPRVCTETGWLTSGDGSITQEQQARLFLTLYLAAFKRGWSHTFVYMLKDSNAQGYWGFFDTEYNPKTSALYLHNLTTILSDDDSITPGYVDYSIPGQPSTVHDLLMQKSDGRFYLALWNEKGNGSDDVTVQLGDAYAAVRVYEPTTGTSPTQALSDIDSVELTLSGYFVVIIELE
jgi:hypothetical protein